MLNYSVTFTATWPSGRTCIGRNMRFDAQLMSYDPFQYVRNQTALADVLTEIGWYEVNRDEGFDVR